MMLVIRDVCRQLHKSYNNKNAVNIYYLQNLEKNF